MAERARILVIEDERSLRRLLTLNLAAEGYEVRSASTAEEAISTLQEQGFLPDLIVLDIMLPGMDGYTLCQRLRADGFDRPSSC